MREVFRLFLDLSHHSEMNAWLTSQSGRPEKVYGSGFADKRLALSAARELILANKEKK